MRDGQNATPRAGRVPRGPVRAGDPEVAGPTSLNRLPVVLERLPDGRHRLTSPDLPGFQAIGRGPHELARNVDQAWNELQIAAYSATRGQAYDLAHHEVRAERPAPGRYGPTDPLPDWRDHRNGYDPALWRPLPGGAWESPAGRRYTAESWQVRQVISKRSALGLPVVHPDDSERA